MEENKEKNRVQGWKDVQVSSDMPLSALVQLLGILNQRLCAVENLVTLPNEDGKTVSLTELYEQQTLKQMEALKKEQEEKAKEQNKSQASE